MAVAAEQCSASGTPVVVRNLTMAYGDFVVQRDLDFEIARGDIFIIMGESGCGKSTLLRHLVGLQVPVRGDIFLGGVNFWKADVRQREQLKRRFGVLFQTGALWSSLTLAENVALPIGEFTDLDAAAIREIVAFKLALVGLGGFEEFYPAELSGGMRKRAALARAMALDPDVLFFDEPSAGLDPVSSRRLDELIVELRETLATTIVVVTHELPSIFAIGNNSVFLDLETRTIIARGNPQVLATECDHPRVRAFLNRGGA